MPIFKGKRNKVGIQAKPRLKSEVNAEYNEHAARLGHAFRMIQEMEIETAKLEAEIKERVNQMRRLDFEGKQAFPDPVPEPEKTPEIAAVTEGSA